MMSWKSLLLFGVSFAAPSLSRPHAQSTSRQACQEVSSSNPLSGCEKGTILVGPKDSGAQYATIQSAIDSLPSDGAATILILAGKYTEQVNITRTAPLTLLGQTNGSSDGSSNAVTVVHSAANPHSEYSDNSMTAVLSVAPAPGGNPEASSDFKAYNIDFRNEFAEQTAGPALALSVSRANTSFYQSGFYSYQDTVLVGDLGNAYFYQNTIAGQTDFLYGSGTAFIENSTLSLRGCGGGITAWKGSNTTFENKYGVYISDSHVQAANSSVAQDYKGRCALGRPWNELHRSVYMNTYLDATVNGSGYIPWDAKPASSKTLMAEYKSYGPGYDKEKTAENKITTVFTSEEEVKPYRTPQDVFLTEDGQEAGLDWIDTDFYPW
ncbi:hypothetical protein KEM55_003376 [Ascosphaera atra]|nr:hypothetical protein KEM55_003376 [Ascosphaera atra]